MLTCLFLKYSKRILRQTSVLINLIMHFYLVPEEQFFGFFYPIKLSSVSQINDRITWAKIKVFNPLIWVAHESAHSTNLIFVSIKASFSSSLLRHQHCSSTPKFACSRCVLPDDSSYSIASFFLWLVSTQSGLHKCNNPVNCLKEFIVLLLEGCQNQYIIGSNFKAFRSMICLWCKSGSVCDAVPLKFIQTQTSSWLCPFPPHGGLFKVQYHCFCKGLLLNNRLCWIYTFLLHFLQSYCS